ncbi:hypothetical protein [Belnapia sp. F-4-1]|uniref:hypothetical protein n=1 Tax=Belnapia sp. F-4-1 TaxID=1545443 RepID=UPI001185A89C|nr:hypothetical protein [Belnapia sp. F-4-1]
MEKEVISPVQVASGIALIVGQVFLVAAFGYWLGFGAVAEISAIRYFSVLESFSNLPADRVPPLIVWILFQIGFTAWGIQMRASAHGFIDKPGITVTRESFGLPAQTVKDRGDALGGAAEPRSSKAGDGSAQGTTPTETPMTPEQLLYYLRWQEGKRLFLKHTKILLGITFALMIGLWIFNQKIAAIWAGFGFTVALGSFVAASDAYVAISLPIRITAGSVVTLGFLAAFQGGRDADLLVKGLPQTIFPLVTAKVEARTVLGYLIFQSASGAMVYERSRVFNLLPASKIAEIRYITLRMQ